MQLKNIFIIPCIMFPVLLLGQGMNVELLKPADAEGYIPYSRTGDFRQEYRPVDSLVASYEIDGDTLNEIQIYSMSDYIVAGDTIGVVLELSENGGEHYLIEGNNITIRRNGTQAIISGLGPGDIQTFRDYINAGSVTGLTLTLNGIGEAGASITFSGWDNNAADDWTTADFIQADIDNWNAAHGWGDHDGLYKLDFSENAAFNNDYGFIAGTVLEGNNKTLIDVNTAKTSNATHTGDVTGATVLTIGANKVTSTKILNSTITAADLGANSVAASEIAANAVAQSELHSLSFTTTNTMSTTDYFLITPTNGVEEKITLSNFKTNNLSEYWSSADFVANDISDWNEAHGWGDHALVGYSTTDNNTFISTTGDGLDLESNNTELYLDFAELTTDASPLSTSFFVYADGAVEKKISFSDLNNVLTPIVNVGTGLDFISNQVQLDFSEFTTHTTMVDGDFLTFYDNSQSDERKITFDDFKDLIPTGSTYTVGTGLDLVSNQIQLDFSEFTEDGTLGGSSYFIFEELGNERRIDFTTLKGLVGSANDSNITISAGTGLTGGGIFSTNQSSAETITINATDASTTNELQNLYNRFVVSADYSGGTKFSGTTVTADNQTDIITFSNQDNYIEVYGNATSDAIWWGLNETVLREYINPDYEYSEKATNQFDEDNKQIYAKSINVGDVTGFLQSKAYANSQIADIIRIEIRAKSNALRLSGNGTVQRGAPYIFNDAYYSQMLRAWFSNGSVRVQNHDSDFGFTDIKLRVFYVK